MAVGDSAQQAAIQSMGQQSQVWDEIAQLLARILSNLSERAEFTKESNEGIKALLKHIQKGKQLDYTPIAKEDAQMVDEILRNSKIPYVMAFDSKAGHVILMTRDSDRKALEDVLNQYAIKKGTELQEIEVNDFLKAYEGREIRVEKNLDAAFVELYREKAKQYDCIYSVVESTENPGKFEIMYPREKERGCENAMKDVAYDFSGEDGRDFKHRITENIRTREDFKNNLRPAGDETVFVCSKKDPTRFLAITKDGFSVHDIQTMREKLSEGGSNVRLVDKNTASFNTFDKEKLGKYLDIIKEPVMLTADEFNIVKGISISGKASFIKDEEFKAAYQKLLETLDSREIGYPKRLAESAGLKKEAITGYENLYGSQVDEIEDRLMGTGLEKYLIQGTDQDRISIAFPERLKDKMSPIIEDVLYKDLEGYEKMQKELLYQGRGTLDIHKAEDIVIDAALPGVALFFDKDCMNIVQRATEEERAQGKKNIPLDRIDRGDPLYDEKVSKIISSMKEVVVIDKDEYRGKSGDEAELSKLIRSRIPSEHKTDAVNEYEKFIEEHQKSMYEAIHKQANDTDHMDELTEKQQEAVRAHYSRSYEDIYVSRSIAEKVTTMDFSDKRYSRTDIYEQQTTSISR